MAPIGERNARAKYWGGREGEEGRGGRRGSRRGGCTRKTGVKSPQKFSTKPLIVLASGERGGKPRIYNVPMANSVPSLLLATLTHRLRIYSCRENSIAGKNHSLPRGGEISSLVSPFFSFLAAFCVARVCQSHDSTSIGPGIYIYICICVKRVVEPCPLSTIPLTNLTRVAIFPDFGYISLDVDRIIGRVRTKYSLARYNTVAFFEILIARFIIERVGIGWREGKQIGNRVLRTFNVDASVLFPFFFFPEKQIV